MRVKQECVAHCQINLVFDTSFRTVKEDNFDQLWQAKAGFLTVRKEEMRSK
jgi:hypothetical protein